MVVEDTVIETQQELQEWCNDNTDSVTGHNIIGYDFPVLKRLWGCDILRDGLVSWRDTLVMSRLSNPQREGGHSLEAWGQKLGLAKVEHQDWDNYSPEMLTRCKGDVQLTRLVLTQVEKELEGFSPESIELEHQVAAIIAEQVRTGWLLDERLCWDLLATLKEKKFELEEEVHIRFKPRCKLVRHIVPKIKKDGATSAVGIKFLGDDCVQLVGGEFSRVDFPDFNLGSRQQIADYLIHFGWKPTKKTDKGSVIVSEEVLENVDIPEAQLIAEYLTVQKRIAFLDSWLESVGDDGRVHGGVNSNGAVTGRMTHFKPNMAQVPSSSSYLGTAMRSCWTSRDGYKIVGVDADALELVMLAHYMNDDTFTQSVSEGSKEDGTDVHTRNMGAAGLSTRDEAKTFIYAFLYGAGDAKVGSIVGGTAADGARIKAKFLANLPALAKLRDNVEKAAKRGYLKGLDGRRVKVLTLYAALNTLLQSGGAIVMKKALVLLDEQIKARGLDAKFVGNIHDEIQLEVVAKDVATLQWLAPACISAAAKHFNLRCPLSGSAQVGDNWSETH